MDDNKLSLLNPQVFYRGSRWTVSEKNFTDGVQERFKTFYAGVRDKGANAYDLDRIATAIFYLRGLLTRSGLTGLDKTAVEIGCGNGNKAFALQGLYKNYIGIDLNEAQIIEAEERNHIYGMAGTRFIFANAATALSSRHDYGIPDKIDILILYAVIEHLTSGERRTVIDLANQIIEDGGHVIVMESPNRLIPYDSHTTGLHFFNWLPDEAAIQIAKSQAKRSEISSRMLPWSNPEAQVALARAGRGVSYHDFEMNFPQSIQDYYFLRDAYEIEMLNMEPLTCQEFLLLGYIKRNLPELPAMAFSRSWLDFILTKKTDNTGSRQFISPHHPKWAVFEEPPLFWEPVSITMNDMNQEWSYEVRNSFVRDFTAIFSSESEAGKLWAQVDEEILDEIDIAELRRCRPSTWHKNYAVNFNLCRRIGKISLKVETGHSIAFQGIVITSSGTD